MEPREATAAIKAGLKYFTLSGLKGRPNIEKRKDFEKMVSVWAENLTEVPVGVFIAACKSLACELTFYPAFAEVRKRCLDLMHGKPQQALEVWAGIKHTMTAVSHPYANPEDRQAALESIACPIAREAAEKFDWKAFGLSDEADESYHKGQFEKLFTSIRDRVGIQRETERLGIVGPGQAEGLIGEVAKQIGKGA